MSDLDRRTALSKSELTTAEWCQWRAWHRRHYYRPMSPKEEIAFGVAVDAGVGELIEQMRAYGRIEDHHWPMQAAAVALTDYAAKSGVTVDLDEVNDAVLGFRDQIMPRFNWTYCATQHHVSVEMEGWGQVDGHPDIILADNSVWDVKTGGKAKRVEDIANSTELGFYALIREAETGDPVPTVGYFSWRRGGSRWVEVSLPVTDEMRERTRARVDAYVRARDMDIAIAAKGQPVNVTLTAGPRFAGLCVDCEYADLCPVRAVAAA